MKLKNLMSWTLELKHLLLQMYAWIKNIEGEECEKKYIILIENLKKKKCNIVEQLQFFFLPGVASDCNEKGMQHQRT